MCTHTCTHAIILLSARCHTHKCIEFKKLSLQTYRIKYRPTYYNFGCDVWEISGLPTLRPHPPYFLPHTLHPILNAPMLSAPYFAPHTSHPYTLRPTLCAPKFCAPILCAPYFVPQYFVIPKHFVTKLHKSIALIKRPILLLSFVYALFKQNQCYGIHN